MRPHPDVDLLALHALGEPVLDDAARAHLDGCARCATTVADLAGTVGAARGPAHEVDPAARVPVPAHVWQGISAELGLDPSVRPASVGPSSLRPRPQEDGSPAREVAAGPVRPAAGDPAVAADPEDPDGSRPGPAAHAAAGAAAGASAGASAGGDGTHDLAARRARRRGLSLLAVAAAGAVVGAAGAALVVPRLAEAPGADEPVVLAAADLEAFGAGEGTDATGSARLASLAGAGADDDRVLQVWLDELPDTGEGFFEAWLIDPDTGAMVSLGPVRTGGPGEVTAELAVPRGLDVEAYDLVDVSAEPLDGDPTHSGASLVRGTLGT